MEAPFELPTSFKGRDNRDARVISISGKAGSGKDTVIKIIIQLGLERHSLMSFVHINFAKVLKEMVCLFDGRMLDYQDESFKDTPPLKTFPPNQDIFESILKGCIPQVVREKFKVESQFEQLFKACKDHYENALTIGVILQKIGTEVFRDLVSPSFWVEVWKNQAQQYLDKGYLVLNSDARFIQEVKAIESMKGNILRVNADPELCAKRSQSKRDPNHPSETSLDNYEFKYKITNNGTIQELFEPVKRFMDEIECLEYF
jgi:hypothetical protein